MQNPQTYSSNQGPAKRYLSPNKGRLRGPFLVSSDIKDPNGAARSQR